MAEKLLTHTLHVRLTPQFHKKLSAVAADERRSETQLARILLEEGIERRLATKKRGAQ